MPVHMSTHTSMPMSVHVCRHRGDTRDTAKRVDDAREDPCGSGLAISATTIYVITIYDGGLAQRVPARTRLRRELSMRGGRTPPACPHTCLRTCLDTCPDTEETQETPPSESMTRRSPAMGAGSLCGRDDAVEHSVNPQSTLRLISRCEVRRALRACSDDCPIGLTTVVRTLIPSQVACPSTANTEKASLETML